MNKDYSIAIPSYKRSDICNTKTLAMLHHNKIPPQKITVYVANKEEYQDYKNKLDKHLYGKLIVGEKGLVQQRQYIMDHTPEGKNIVFLDDDVESVDLSLSPLFKTHSLDFFLKTAFEKTRAMGAYIWGVYPVFNPFFRKPREEISTCLNYIVGAFYGIINRPKNKHLSLVLTKENGQKEDVERTIRYFKEDGIVVRFNKIGFVTKYYGSTGGLGRFEERLQPMLEASNRLKKEFPDYGDISTKKNGMTEFRLKKINATQKNTSETERGNAITRKAITRKAITRKAITRKALNKSKSSS
jgi:hypothetical protein